MLTVFISYRGRIVYLHPFSDHKEAIEHFSKIRVDSLLDDEAVLGITNEKTISLGESPPIFYVS